MNITNLWSAFSETVRSPQRHMINAAKKIVRRIHARNVLGIAPVRTAVVDNVKPNPFISTELRADVAQLTTRYLERRITHFLLDPKNIERQNTSIAKAAIKFFDSAESLRGASLEELKAQVSEYRDVYLNAPITRNNYGLHFSTGLFLFLIARRRNPSLVVESGVYKGLSTFFLSSACPTAELHAFDPNLTELSFRSTNATYHHADWMSENIRCRLPQSGLVFFDDHQCQARRVIEAHERGFRHLVFDDGWPIEAVTGCGWPPIPSVDMVMDDCLEPNETVQWVEDGKIWTYVHDQEMQQLCAKARALILAAYDVPTLYRPTGLAPTSAMKYVELVK